VLSRKRGQGEALKAPSGGPGGCSKEGHVTREVALEITLPGSTQVRALAAWYYLRRRHPLAVQGDVLYQDVTDLKEALRLALAGPLAEARHVTVRQVSRSTFPQTFVGGAELVVQQLGSLSWLCRVCDGSDSFMGGIELVMVVVSLCWW
jgi:hypothetical protein